MLIYDEFNDICSPRFITVNTDNRFADYIREEFDKLQMRATLHEDYILPTCEIKKMLKKETEKMEAKKCDRCGKLYEMPSATENEGAEVRFKFIKVSDVENKSGTKIAKEQMRNIYIRKTSCCDSSSYVDICPDCRKSLKKWFESTDKEEK